MSLLINRKTMERRERRKEKRMIWNRDIGPRNGIDRTLSFARRSGRKKTEENCSMKRSRYFRR